MTPAIQPALPSLNRRFFLSRIGLAAAFFTAPGAYAEELTHTPPQTEGPFYPDHLPLDTDNDLLIVNDSLTPASGEVTYVSGRVLGPTGAPVRNAQVEIWQADVHGAYIHTRSFNAAERDPNFQGFGRFLTSSTGEYCFRTIKPVPYSGRCPHIHYKIKAKGHELLTTQLYIKGHPQNDRDGVRREIEDPRALEAVTVDFVPLPGSKAGELTAKFDIVLGSTPEM
jgi:protocatechuate 3,4-dioxygenase beta subunit